ncbi:hypothetical protein [Longimicrobium sp.]|uniref:hypothetical protein n=1 Tax=Longimicrobium sp. TaxID=2029185 RepID=UPI003B3B0EE9
MTANPTVWGRMVARLQGEVPATTLEAYRRASLQVFELMDQVEARRRAGAAGGLNPWTVPAATRAEFLCAWNAFALQTLGNDLLDADYAAVPVTAGFVPPITADQVLRFFSQVEAWVNRAQQARANPGYVLDVSVPADLPSWSRVKPVPTTHLRGLIHAMQAVADHASAALSFLPAEAPGEGEQQAQINRIHQLYASAQSKARYAADLHGAAPTRELHGRVEPHVRAAIELFYQVGQLIADPTLATETAVARPDPRPAPAVAPPDPPRSPLVPAPPAPPHASDSALEAWSALEEWAGPHRRSALPGKPGFDLWALTDPVARHTLERDPEAKRALRKMWKMDPRPARTLAVHDEIRAAFGRGDIAYAGNGTTRVGHFHCCPWSPVFVARRKVSIGGTRVRAMEQFVYDVGWSHAEGTFRRRIVVGAFQETSKVEYGPHRLSAK